MKFLTNDGRFGLLVTRVTGSGVSRFQLIVAGRLIGNSELCFAYGAFEEMASLPRFSDERLRPPFEKQEAALSALVSEEKLHDPATLSLAESLDHWLVQGFMFEESAVMVARPYEDGTPAESALISIVGRREYADVVEMARHYWAQGDRRFLSESWQAKII
ncbi:hypothetical protein [Streptacidiphilus monticola]|uniref:Uncharacterized protein n=1 Tax=Streptacidiphilus monticola TaxID=2161674 RepID=A0ABW1GBG1_9ACTN